MESRKMRISCLNKTELIYNYVYTELGLLPKELASSVPFDLLRICSIFNLITSMDHYETIFCIISVAQFALISCFLSFSLRRHRIIESELEGICRVI